MVLRRIETHRHPRNTSCCGQQSVNITLFHYRKHYDVHLVRKALNKVNSIRLQLAVAEHDFRPQKRRRVPVLELDLKHPLRCTRRDRT